VPGGTPSPLPALAPSGFLTLPRPDLAIPGAVALAVLAFWGGTDGGYGELVWYPGGLLLLVLLLVTEYSVPGRRLDRRSCAALGAFAAFTAWSYLTLLWADDRGLAFTGANRTLVYLIVFLIALRRPWRGRQIAAWTAIWAFAITGIGLTRLVVGLASTDPSSMFDGGRLGVPVQYSNANAALFVLGLWPLVSLAQAKPAHPALRGLALAGAGACFDLALLAQSKGAALGGLVAACFYFVVGRHRVRLAIPLLLVFGAALAIHGPLLDVYSRINAGDDGSHAVRSAALAILASSVVLLVAGLLVAVLDTRFFGVSSRRATWLTRGAGVALAALVAAVAIAAVLRVNDPTHLVSRSWHAFKTPSDSSDASTHFLTTAGNHRYDFWRVAAQQFRRSPLTGAGVENFAADYVKLRRSGEEPLYPHSLEARLLGGTGIIGFLLFGAFVALISRACISAARSRTDSSAAGLLAATMLVYWLAHGSVDWLWEFPALSAPVLFVAGSLASARVGSPHLERARMPTLFVGAVAAAASFVVLVPAWLAARDTATAAHEWHRNAPASYTAIGRAARLNPLSDIPYVTGGTIAEQRRDWVSVRHFFLLALDRNERDWYSHLELGIAASRLGDHAQALAALARARALNPREPVVRSVERQIRRGKPVAVAVVDRDLAESIALRVGK
jgi:O-antigen ligase